jgi:hypothetical protein
MAVSRAISRLSAGSAASAALAASLVGVSAATLAACETTVPRCAFAACGGALEGQWTIRERCPAPPADCPGARVDYAGTTLDGTFTFTGAMTYAATVRQRGTIVATVPLACHAGAASCTAVEAELRATAARDPTARIAAVTCSGAAVCTCRQTLKDAPITESGTYRMSGSRVILTSGGDATTDEYCVAGKELRLRASMTGVAVGDVLVLSK